jgi:hypothetical protein
MPGGAQRLHHEPDLDQLDLLEGRPEGIAPATAQPPLTRSA